MKGTNEDGREPLPAPVERAIEGARRALNRHVLLDALLCALGGAVIAAAPVAVVAVIAGWPASVVRIASALGGALVFAWEARRRWHDPLDAALVLDRVLGANDRFSTALQFARDASPPSLHRLQIKETGTFLESVASPPKMPRPRMRAGRYATAAVAALGVAVPLMFVVPELVGWIAGDDGAAPRQEPRTADEIAAAAEALRARLANDPDRRLDAEINALEHDLEEQRRRATEDRAAAIAEAAEILERAAGITPEAESAEAEATEPQEAQTAQTALPRSVDEDPPENASRRLMEEWERARDSMQRWREAASSPHADPYETSQLQREAQRRQMEALQIARQEQSWQRSRSAEETRDERRLTQQRREQGESAADRLQQSVDRLDRALAQLHRDDESRGLPPPEVGQALTRAAEQLHEHTPETSSAMDRAAQARTQGDGERMDRALEQARRALQREAGAEPERFADARRRLDELHDEVARRAAERGEGQGEQLAQNDQGQNGQGQSGRNGQDGQSRSGQNGRGGQDAQGQRGQTGQSADGQNGDGQTGEGQGQTGQGQGQTGQGQNGQGGHGQGQNGQGQNGQSGQGQGQGQNGQGQGQGQRGQGIGQGQQGQGQPGGGVGGGQAQGVGQGQGAQQLGGGQGRGQGQGNGQGHTPGGGQGQGGQGEGTSERGSQSWGSGSGGNPLGGGPGGGAGAADQGVNVDPGTDPTQNAELGPDVDPGGLLPGGGRGTSRGGAQMDGIASGADGPGSGELAGGGEEGPRVSGDSTVPASLRAYVRRYLERIRGGEQAR